MWIIFRELKTSVTPMRRAYRDASLALEGSKSGVLLNLNTVIVWQGSKRRYTLRRGMEQSGSSSGS